MEELPHRSGTRRSCPRLEHHEVVFVDQPDWAEPNSARSSSASGGWRVCSSASTRRPSTGVTWTSSRSPGSARSSLIRTDWTCLPPFTLKPSETVCNTGPWCTHKLLCGCFEPALWGHLAALVLTVTGKPPGVPHQQKYEKVFTLSFRFLFLKGRFFNTDSEDHRGDAASSAIVPPTPAFPVSPPTPYGERRRPTGQTPARLPFVDSASAFSSQ